MDKVLWLMMIISSFECSKVFCSVLDRCLLGGNLFLLKNMFKFCFCSCCVRLDV